MRGQRTALAKAAAVEALHGAGLSVREIGRATQLAKTTVHDILSGHGAWDQIKTLEQFQQRREELKRVLQAAMLELITQGLGQIEVKLPEASAKDAAIVVGIMAEKERLLAGEATQHIAVMTRQEVADLDALAERLGRALLARQQLPEGHP